MANKIILYVLSSMIILAVGLALYVNHIADEPCRKFERISADPELNTLVQIQLLKYLTIPEVVSKLQGKAGIAFSTAELGAPLFSADILKRLDISNSNLLIFIHTDRGDRRFDRPYNILKVGIGYSRIQLMYESDSSINGDLGDAQLKLRDDSYVVCQVS